MNEDKQDTILEKFAHKVGYILAMLIAICAAVVCIGATIRFLLWLF